MEKLSPRRLRSASVHLGALTALALTLSGCNQVGDDDDDCDSRSSTNPTPRPTATAQPIVVPTVEARVGGRQPAAAIPTPTQSGFGTHLASCGG